MKSRQAGSREAEETSDSKLPQINKPSTENSKVVITGDDVLIEYVTRLILKINSIEESQLSKAESDCIESFVSHYVWHNEDVIGGKS